MNMEGNLFLKASRDKFACTDRDHLTPNTEEANLAVSSSTITSTEEIILSKTQEFDKKLRVENLGKIFL